MEKPKISFKEFIEISDKLQINVGKITTARRIEGTDKLIEMVVEFGQDLGVKKCVTNLGEHFEPKDFIGSKLPFVMNLEPAKMKGVTSEVMLMVGEIDEDFELSLETFSVGAKLM